MLNRTKTQKIGWLAFFLVASACAGGDELPGDPNESFLDQMSTADGKADAIIIDEGSAEALGILAVVNELDFETLDDTVALDVRAAEGIVVYREGAEDDPSDDRTFRTLDELDRIPWVGMSAFRKLYDFAGANGYIERFRQPVIACTQTSDCGEGAVCYFEVCADVTEVSFDLGTGYTDFGVSDAGEWWVREENGTGDPTYTDYRGTDSLESTESGSYPDTANYWGEFKRLPDGELTVVGSVGGLLAPEFGEALDLGNLDILDAAYSPDGTLYVAAEADEDTKNVAVHRQTVLGWRLDGEFAVEDLEDDWVTTALTFAQNGTAQLWIDQGGSAVRYDRAAEGEWNAGFTLDHESAGFGELGWSRFVQIEQRNAGTVHFVREYTEEAGETVAEYMRIVGDTIETTLDTEPYDLFIDLTNAITADDRVLLYRDDTLVEFDGDEVRRSELDASSSFPNVHTDAAGNVFVRSESWASTTIMVLKPRG